MNVRGPAGVGQDARGRVEGLRRASRRPWRTPGGEATAQGRRGKRGCRGLKHKSNILTVVISVVFQIV